MIITIYGHMCYKWTHLRYDTVEEGSHYRLHRLPYRTVGVERDSYQWGLVFESGPETCLLSPAANLPSLSLLCRRLAGL